MKLNEYQNLSCKTDQRGQTIDELSRVIPLLGLIGEIGSVAAEHKKRLRDGQSYSSFEEKFKEELGDVLWYIATLASDMSITLEDVAKKNLAKTQERWADTKSIISHELFDKDFPKGERLPREMTLVFKADQDGRIGLYHGKNQLGNALTDNAHEDDGYRFHDVFHLAFMAVLGWSPVIRKLLNRKRRSNEKVDEVEDGARAIIIEEAISAMIYEHSKDYNFFQKIEVIDYEVLKTIKGMVRNFEVKNVPSSLWEKAIIDGYDVYRQLRENNGGKVYINLNKRTIKFLC